MLNEKQADLVKQRITRAITEEQGMWEKSLPRKEIDIFEINMMKLFRIARNLIRTRGRRLEGSKPELNEEIIGIAVAIQNMMTYVDTHTGSNIHIPAIETSVSAIFKEDLRQLYNDYMTKFPFDGTDLLKLAPELLLDPTKHHRVSNPQAPYKHQLDMINFVKDRVSTSRDFFTIYSAPIGTGKTTTCIAIANIKCETPIKILFVCSEKFIRYDVGSQAINSNTLFAMVSQNDGKLTCKPYRTAKKADRQVDKRNIHLYICDAATAKIILEGKFFDQEYILPSDKIIVFIDEPTIHASVGLTRDEKLEIKRMKNLKNTVFCHSWLPFGVIYSTATPPRDMYLRQLLEDRRILSGVRDQPNYITSDLVLIQSSLSTNNGTEIYPWAGCENREDVINTRRTISENPFIARFLTVKSAMVLHKKMTDAGINMSSVNLDEEFKIFTNLKPNKIRELVLDMLRLLSNSSDAFIRRICQIQLETDTEELVDYCYNKETRDMILVGSYNPERDVRALLDPSSRHRECKGDNGRKDRESITLTEEVADQYMELIQKYKQEYKTYLIEEERYQEIMSITRSRERDVDYRGPKTGNQKQTLDVNPPISPERHFISQFKPIYIEGLGNLSVIPDVSGRVLREYPDVDNLIFILALYGIVVYKKKYNKAFIEMINGLIENAEARYVFSADFAYGINYAFTKIIILDNYVRHNTMNTVLQLTGRSGRVGKSNRSSVIISSLLARRLLRSIQHPDAEEHNLEGQNIARAYESLRSENNFGLVVLKRDCEQKIQRVADHVRQIRLADKARRDQAARPAAKPVEVPAEEVSWDTLEEDSWNT